MQRRTDSFLPFMRYSEILSYTLKNDAKGRIYGAVYNSNKPKKGLLYVVFSHTFMKGLSESIRYCLLAPSKYLSGLMKSYLEGLISIINGRTGLGNGILKRLLPILIVLRFIREYLEALPRKELPTIIHSSFLRSYIIQ